MFLNALKMNYGVTAIFLLSVTLTENFPFAMVASQSSG